MKQESLEALLIDRSLGELSPEAGELLAEYLVAHPEAAITARELEQTLDSARDFARQDLASIAPVVSAPWRQEASIARFWRWWPQVAGLAACLALGIMIGWGGSARKSHSEMALPALVHDMPMVEDSRPVSSQLWSLSRLVEASNSQPSPAVGKRYRVTWDPRSLKPRFEAYEPKS